MRSQVYNNHPLHPNQPPDIPGQWKCYNPRTNLTWLLFLLTILLRNRKAVVIAAEVRKPLGPRSINHCQKTEKLAQSESSCRNPKGIKTGKIGLSMNTPEKERASILKLERELSERLQLVLQLLDLKEGDENLTCAGDLV